MSLRTLLLAALLALATPALASTPYVIDPTHTQVEFTYSHFGFSNITGRFDTVESEFSFDPANPANSRVKVTLPVASISTGVEKLDQHLLAADFFDAEKFPTATFESTGVTAAGEGKLAVAGNLTIHGVTRPVVLDVTINKLGEHPMRKVPAAGFDGRVVIKRSDFGIGNYAPAVSDEVTIEITVEAYQAPAGG